MYLFNRTTGELKQANKLSKGYTEVNAEQYNELQKLEMADRIGELPDLECHNLEATGTIRASSGDKVAEMDKDGVKSNGGIEGQNAAGDTTITIDGQTGNIDSVGKVKAADGEFTNKPMIPGKDGKPAPAATITDIDAAQHGVEEVAAGPSKTVSVTGTKANPLLDVVIATLTQAGVIKPGGSLSVLPDGTLNIKIATDTVIGGVLVKGGGTGIDITPEGVIYLDGAISPFLYMGTWSAKTNTPTISDKTGKPDSFYLCLEKGTQDLGSGKIDFEVGDWALCEEDEGKPASQHYVNVPMSQTIVVSASQIKPGTLGKGIGMDTDQAVKTSAGVSAADVVASNSITTKNITITGKMTFTKG